MQSILEKGCHRAKCRQLETLKIHSGRTCVHPHPHEHGVLMAGIYVLLLLIIAVHIFLIARAKTAMQQYLA